MIRKQVFITPEQNRRLKERAALSGVAEAQLIRQGIDMVLKKEKREDQDWKVAFVASPTCGRIMTKSTKLSRGAEVDGESVANVSVLLVLMRPERAARHHNPSRPSARPGSGSQMAGPMEERAALSVVSLTEVYAGARNQREERQIAQLEAFFRWLPVTTDIARRAGVFLRLYEMGHGIDDADALIAATAEHHGHDLATLNMKHFPMFPRLEPPY